MVLCSRCASIDFGLLVERACTEAEITPGPVRLPLFRIMEGIRFSDIKDAALQGCELCGMIRYGLLELPDPLSSPRDLLLVDHTSIELSLTLENCHWDLSRNYAQCYGLHASYPTFLSESIARVMLTLSSNDVTSPYLSRNRSSWSPLLWRSWIDECVESHEPCYSLDRTKYTPTRLIDVRSAATTPRLVESCGEFPDYVALSHCWGGSLPLRTTTTNLHDHLDGIPWELMPATFRDAVSVTRAMGYPFLWIDCLCIIQDSESDWLHECALMLQVYAGAVVTIAASQSKSPSDGIFRATDWPSYACSVPICWPSNGEHDSLTVDLPAQPRFWGPQSATIGPLSQRGWALQEQVLSKRVLHLCASGAFFECAYCERTDRLPWPTGTAKRSESLQFSRAFLQLNDPQRILAEWYGLVFHYAGRCLTYGGDRLPAVSGIARLVAGLLHQSYLAGLWSDDLVVGLLWTVANPELPSALHAPRYPGPSWSWASVNRTISLPTFGIRKRHTKTWFKGWKSVSQLEACDWAPCLEVHDWSVELAGDDTYAEVKSGRLTILGKIRLVMIGEPKDTYGGQSLRYNTGHSVYVLYYPDVSDPLIAREKRRAAFCLVAGFHRHLLGSPYCCILVVQPVLGHSATFRRIGSMFIYDNQLDGEGGETFHSAVDWLLAAEDQQIYLV